MNFFFLLCPPSVSWGVSFVLFPPPTPIHSVRRKARRNYEVMDKFKAGIELLGSEVKSCRSSKVNMEDGYAQVRVHHRWDTVSMEEVPFILVLV